MFEREIKAPALANEINCNRHSINYYLKGSLPSLEIAIRLANYFNCSIDLLFGIVDEDCTTNFRPAPPFSEWFPQLLKEYNISRYKLHFKTHVSENILRS